MLCLLTTVQEGSNLGHTQAMGLQLDQDKAPSWHRCQSWLHQALDQPEPDDGPPKRRHSPGEL